MTFRIRIEAWPRSAAGNGRLGQEGLEHMLSLAQLLTSPEWFPDAIYADRGLLDCYRVDRRLLTESSFLDQRMTSRAAGKIQTVFTPDELVQLAAGAHLADFGFIFHTSFCRSTLMAQALHVDGISFTLKEPSILLSVAESVRYTHALREPDKIRVALPAMLRLASGLAAADEKVIVKPTNFANNLLPYIAESGAKILLMYSDLKSYLLSILKYGERGRAFTRQLFIRLMVDSREFGGMDPKQIVLLTDLQIAALAWKQQIGLFRQILGSAAQGQTASVDSAIFGAHRDAVLAGVFEFFGIPITPHQLAQILSGPVFQQHSKSGKSIDDQALQQQNRALEEKYRDELHDTEQWAEATPLGGPIGLPLANSLAVTGISTS